MFGIPKSLLTGLWAFAFSSPEYSFQNPRLQGALDFYKEGQELARQGEYRDACDAFMTGIFSGRKVVEEMQGTPKNDDPEEESSRALEWLVSSYLACAEARMQLEDWQTARSDAWAACMYSNNQNLQALECMLTVCENTKDCIGQLSTLKSIRLVLAGSSDNDGSNGGSSRYSLDQVDNQIVLVEKKLEEKFRSKNNNDEKD